MDGVALTSLAHHIDQAWMFEAFRRTRKEGATGIDGQTAREYSEHLGENLQSLLDRAKSGTYWAPPVRRVHIPKGDGSKTRPIGIPTVEDKVLQRAVLMALEPVYENDFYDFSYGFRPGRSPAQALQALDEGLHQMGGGWVLDVDVSAFFDTLDHAQLRDLLRKRVADGVIVRLVGKWLRAGVMEGGVVTRPSAGSPQGGVISPLLANIYLHEVLDRWWVEEVLPRLRGRAFLVRYADDFVIAFSHQGDAERVQEVLSKRFMRFGLTLHPEKTRLVRFCRPPRDGGGPGPGSFDFLGFTHYWGQSRRGLPCLSRKTSKSRFTRALRTLNLWFKAVRHIPIEVQARQLAAKLRGYFGYYGVRGNSRAINRFHYEARKLWHKWLRRRSQRTSMTWSSFNLMLERYPIPAARLIPPQSQLRLANL
jgi:group II intron reverse transcriptase/maturase